MLEKPQPTSRQKAEKIDRLSQLHHRLEDLTYRDVKFLTGRLFTIADALFERDRLKAVKDLLSHEMKTFRLEQLERDKELCRYIGEQVYRHDQEEQEAMSAWCESVGFNYPSVVMSYPSLDISENQSSFHEEAGGKIATDFAEEIEKMSKGQLAQVK